MNSKINHTETAVGFAGLAFFCIMMKIEKILSTLSIENNAVRLDIEEKVLVLQLRLLIGQIRAVNPKLLPSILLDMVEVMLI